MSEGAAWLPAVKLPARGPDADKRDESSSVTPVMRGWICDSDSVWWGEGRISTGAAPTPGTRQGHSAVDPSPSALCDPSGPWPGRQWESLPVAHFSAQMPGPPEHGLPREPGVCAPQLEAGTGSAKTARAHLPHRKEKQLVAMATCRPASFTTGPAAQARA